MSDLPTTNFNYPCEYRLGPGRARELGDLCRERGVTRPLIVTDAGVAALPWFTPLVEGIQARTGYVEIHSAVHSNPIEADVTSGLAAYKKGQCNGVVLIGGGAALDVGKCVALLADNPGGVFDYEDVGTNWKRADGSRIPPMIAVPTTAGTGSEVGRASVIVNERHEKKIIFHPKMQPPVVVADPELTLGLPPAITAFTGMDAFIHCFEAYCARGYHPMADGIALEGMRLVHDHLEKAVNDGNDGLARTNMLLASSMGATAFQKGLGIVHAISHALGGRFDVHHGKANAMLLPYCMVFNRNTIENHCTRIAAYLGLAEPSFDALLAWIVGLRERIGIPSSLVELRLSDADLAGLVDPALADPSLAGNPKDATGQAVLEVLTAARDGNLGG